MAGHVGYESWLERDHLMWLDWDRAVTGIASQPFWLSWTEPEGKARSHVPDFFAGAADGSAVVVDCRPADAARPRDLAAFEATRRACGLVGWEYRLVGAPDPIVTANLRWLAGYRHPRHGIPPSWRRRCGPRSPRRPVDGRARRRRVTRSRCCRCCFTCCGGRSWPPTCRCRCTRVRP